MKLSDAKTAVFLDIDGVMNNLGTFICGRFGRGWCATSIRLLELLCEHSEAIIIVSSAWRHGQSIEQLQATFSELASPVIGKLIVGKTARSISGIRGHEIDEWITSNKWKKPYLIIDDDSDMLPGQPFIKTSFDYGFQGPEFRRAMKLLGIENRPFE